MFESLGHSVTAALGILETESPTRVVVGLEKQRQIVESRLYPEAPASLLIKKRDAAFAQDQSGPVIVIALVSLLHIERFDIDDNVAAERATVFDDNAGKVSVAYFGGKARRRVQYDRSSRPGGYVKTAK